MSVDGQFRKIFGLLWSDYPSERHTASDKLRTYTQQHHIHPYDVLEPGDPSDGQLSKLRRENRTLQDLVDKQQKELQQATDQRLTLKQDCQKKAAQVRALEERLGRLERELKVVTEQATAGRKELMAEKAEAERLCQALAASQITIAKQQDRLKQAAAFADSLDTDLRKARDTCHALRTELTETRTLVAEQERALHLATATALQFQRAFLALKQRRRQEAGPARQKDR